MTWARADDVIDDYDDGGNYAEYWERECVWDIGPSSLLAPCAMFATQQYLLPTITAMMTGREGLAYGYVVMVV